MGRENLGASKKGRQQKINDQKNRKEELSKVHIYWELTVDNAVFLSY